MLFDISICQIKDKYKTEIMHKNFNYLAKSNVKFYAYYVSHCLIMKLLHAQVISLIAITGSKWDLYFRSLEDKLEKLIF